MKKFKEIEENLALLEEALMINESVYWWEKEMNKTFRKIKQAERQSDQKQIKILLKQLGNLIGKGEVEVKYINSWMAKKDKLHGKKKS